LPESAARRTAAISLPTILTGLIPSGIAVLVLAGLAALARLARPTPPLDEAAARGLLADDFPEAQIDRIWLAADGSAALARSGPRALYLFRLGDAWVARDLAWAEAASAPVREGRLYLRLPGVSPRLARPALAGWVPEIA
jgi:hypothetical protein